MKQPKARKPPKQHKPPKRPAGKPGGGGGGAGGGGGGGQKPQHQPHLTPQQQRRQLRKQRQARIKSLETQLHHARHSPLVAPKQKPQKRRGLPLGGVAECCAAEAVAATLRLAGWRVGDADVWALHQAAGGTVDAAVTILDALEAAAAVWPVRFAAVDLDDPAASVLGVDLPGSHAVCADGARWWSWGTQWAPSAFPDAVIEEAWAVTL